jgi:hypothetical protein
MRAVATILSTSAVFALLVAATPNGSVLSFNGDASIWYPSSAPTQLTILPSQIRAMADAGYVWEDLRVPLAMVSKANAAPSWVEFMDSTGTGGSGGVGVWSFSDSSQQDLALAAQMPHGWAPGTETEAHIHWAMLSDNIGVTDGGSLVARWSLECALGEVYGRFTVADRSTKRAHSGTTATITLGASHKYEIGQNIVVSGVTETGGCAAGAYNGNFRITALTASTISYEGGASCSDGETADTGGVTTGYTIVRTADGVVSSASKWKHQMASFGTYRMANCGTVSCIWVCSIERLAPIAGDLGEGVAALEIDWHYMRGAEGSSTVSSY